MEGITPQDCIQRSKGQISFKVNGSRIEKLYQSGCSKLFLPKTYGEMREAVMVIVFIIYKSVCLKGVESQVIICKKKVKGAREKNKKEEKLSRPMHYEKN